MSNSPLVEYTKLSPHKTSPRNHRIDKITIHHMAGDLSVETCGNVFRSRKASANYGVGTDGRVAMYVEEKDRSWASSNKANDHRAVTIEVANDGGAATQWHVSDKALEKTIELCVDICRRNGMESLNYTGNKNGDLTMHSFFTATACPGPYLKSKFPYIAEEVSRRLKGGEAGEEEKATAVTARKPARYFDKSLAGTYRAKCPVNVRHGAGTVHEKMVTVPEGTQVRCYGYYSKVGSSRWLYLRFSYGGVTYTGFANSKWFER